MRFYLKKTVFFKFLKNFALLRPIFRHGTCGDRIPKKIFFDPLQSQIFEKKIGVNIQNAYNTTIRWSGSDFRKIEKLFHFFFDNELFHFFFNTESCFSRQLSFVLDTLTRTHTNAHMHTHTHILVEILHIKKCTVFNEVIICLV